MHTADLAKENYEKLAALFPNAVTETVDEEGHVVRAIDKDVLMQEINTQVVDDGQERYQFTWPDKRKTIMLANQPIAKTLRLDREKSVSRDGTQGGDINSENIYIEGDNLDALKILRETYLGKVKMIYIDPPYNTGNDFIYEDDFSQKAEDYADNSGQTDEEGNRLVQNSESNGRFHTDWLNMLYPRLKVAKDLLSDDGVVFISIDDNEVENLLKIGNEIFGEDNFINEITWYYYNKMAPKSACFPRTSDKILLYSKTQDYIFYNQYEARETAKKQLVRKFVDGKAINARDENGNVMYTESTEKRIDDVWRIAMLQPADKTEPVGYATQKPELLVNRVISASSDPNMIVADFFRGSGTTAACANKLGRKFIHCDIGLNSIQTTRDRLVADGAEFDVLEIKDGVQLYRNPVLTMDKIKSLIPGLKNEDSLDSFWEGAISDSKLGTIPVYVPNLMDSSSKLLDKVTMNRIIHQAIPELDNNIKKVIVYYIDITDETEIQNFIKEDDSTTVELNCVTLKLSLTMLLSGTMLNSMQKKLQMDMQLPSINSSVTVCFLKLQNLIKKPSLILLQRNHINLLKSAKKVWNLSSSLAWIALQPMASGILRAKSKLIKTVTLL